MAKLKNIIKQLSEKDYKGIYDSLMEGNAEKSAFILKSLRERQLSDSKIMVEIEVNSNAYYTLRSRLNQKIEEHLLQTMESPRTDILRKVANLNEVLFTKKRTISITTLKKMERELIELDLPNELTIVYKSLKKIHVNSPEYFQYSQLYNRHVAFMLAVDKAEDLMADYVKKYGYYYLSGGEIEKLGLILLAKEMQNVARLYDSHRLYVYQSIMIIFHRLFVDKEENLQEEGETIEDIFDHVQRIFNTYTIDPLYYHINLVFEFLKLEYYNHYKVYRQAEKYYEEVNDAGANLLVNYAQYTFTAQFLVSRLERHLRLGTEEQIHVENEGIFVDFEDDPLDVPKHTIYIVYRALAYYYVEKYEEGAKLINGLLDELTLKKLPIAMVEVRTVLCLLYVMMEEFQVANQLSNSIQRQVRVLGKNQCKNVMVFLKILQLAASQSKKNKPKKLNSLISKFKAIKVDYFAPTKWIKMDEEFVDALTKLRT